MNTSSCLICGKPHEAVWFWRCDDCKLAWGYSSTSTPAKTSLKLSYLYDYHPEQIGNKAWVTVPIGCLLVIKDIESL